MDKTTESYKGSYSCYAENAFGSDKVSLSIRSFEPLGVSINSTLNSIQKNELGNLSTVIRINRKLEVTLFPYIEA